MKQNEWGKFFKPCRALGVFGQSQKPGQGWNRQSSILKPKCRVPAWWRIHYACYFSEIYICVSKLKIIFLIIFSVSIHIPWKPDSRPSQTSGAEYSSFWNCSPMWINNRGVLIVSKAKTVKIVYTSIQSVTSSRCKLNWRTFLLTFSLLNIAGMILN